jgi:hypothetical protein
VQNPLVVKIKEEFVRLGMQDAELVREAYDEQSFGNGWAVFRMGNLHLTFVRDRGLDTVDFMNPLDLSEHYYFEDLSLALGWVTPDELSQKSSVRGPAQGWIALGEALELIQEHQAQLQEMFSASEVSGTIARLKEAISRRAKA